MNRLQACLFLRFIPGLGNIRSRKLWEFSDSPEAIFERSPKDFQTLEGIGSVHLQHLKCWKEHSDRVYKAEEKLHKNNIKTLFLGDADYPQTLGFCPDAPLVLFYKGNLDFAQRKCISIVGTRSSDSKGEKLCRDLVAGLQEFDPIIISGFARGIDIIAHDQALKIRFDHHCLHGTRSGSNLSSRTQHFLRQNRAGGGGLFMNLPLRKSLTANTFLFATVSLRVCLTPQWSFNLNPKGEA